MPHAIVLVESGPSAGRKLVLAPHTTLLVGRDEEAGLCLARDATVSRQHCRITWDGESALVQDLGSVTGTQLDGRPIEKAERAGHGSWLRIGESQLCMYVEGHTPSRGPAPDARRTAAAAEALAALSGEAHLHVVLDAARSERILELVRESVDDHRSLYDGNSARSLADVAPYLVRLRPGSRLLPKLVHEGWGDAWGVYFTSDEPFKEVRKQLRRFLIVEEESSTKHLYFRFYDPRVLREFMPLATPRQQGELFGAIAKPASDSEPTPHIVSAMLFEGDDLELVRVRAPAGVRRTSGETLVSNP